MLETRIIDIIEGKRKAPITKALLTVMGQCYRFGSFMRHTLYDWVIPTTKLPIPVISVGNIVAGGSGKTPFVAYLAKALAQKKVAIATRGYRRKNRKTVVVKEKTTAAEAGDEPLMLARQLTEATVIVDRAREFSGFLAKEMYGAEILILDDGMQYRPLEKDLEIVVMHADDLFGKDHFLPRGYLRDSPKRLKTAHLIIVNGIQNREQYEIIDERLSHLSSAPVVAMNQSVINSVEVASKKIATFCAVAHPKRFYDTLKNLGCDIIDKEEKPDHIAFTKEEIVRLCNRASSAQVIVCTEKDFVKLPTDLSLSIPLIPLRIEVEPFFGQEHLETILQRLLS